MFMAILDQNQSSRRLEREACRNVEVMWLTGRLVPDHKTIADFRKDNGRDCDNAFLISKGPGSFWAQIKIGYFLAQLDDRIGSLTRDVLKNSGHSDADSEKPIFVVGMPRSGTTLTEQIIAAHRRMADVFHLSWLSRSGLTAGQGQTNLANS